MEIFNGLGEAPPSGKRATREKNPSDDLFGMSRRNNQTLNGKVK